MSELATAPYRIGFRDHNAFVGIWLRRTVFSKSHTLRFVVLAALAATVGYFQSSGFAGASGLAFVPVVAVITGVVVSALLVYLLWPFLIWLWQMTRWVMSPMRRRRQSLRIVEAGLEKMVDDGRITYPWDQFSDFSEGSKRALLFLGPNSAVIIPKSAFASADDASAFMAAVSTRIRRKPHKDPAQNF